jgi:uncharacterized membrane protein
MKKKLIKKNKLELVITILIAFQIIFSIYLIYQDLSSNGVCTLNSCDIVRNSSYSEILGIKLSYFALFSFSVLFILNFSRYKILFLASVTIGSVFALYFIFLQIFVLRAICTNCMIIDLNMLLILILTFFKKNKVKQNKNRD